jgi:4-hydroxy-tetrahydrodipicolinate reductase
MRIALIGYGKMGKAIEEVALHRGHEIVIKIDQPNLHEFTKENMAKADAAIEFTSPHTAYDNIKSCIEFGVPVVSGSTGWTERLEEMKKIAADKKGAFIYSSNFSVGVNIFFEVNKKWLHTKSMR